ncbi:MAG: TraB/GumN family protein [Rubricoccaceae bacterium]
MRARAILSGLLLLLPCVLHAQSADWRPILYTVEGAPGRVHLLGSIHRLPEPLGPWPAIVKAAYASSSLVFFETSFAGEPDDFPFGDGPFSGFDPQGRPLHTRLSEAERARLETGLKLLGLNPAATELAVEPWALSLIVLDARGEEETLPGVDELFMAHARKDRKPVLGLETAADAVGAFRNTSFEEQVAYLLSVAAPGPEGTGFGTLYRAWRLGDEGALQAIIEADFGQTPGLAEALLARRNRRWLPQLEAVLQTPGQTAFVVVGAAHLFGSDSVVELLRQAGYRVTRR